MLTGMLADIASPKIDQKTFLNHVSRGEFKKKVDVWVPQQLS